MQIRVKGRSLNDIIEAGHKLGIFLEPKQGRGEDVWFGYGYLDLDKSTPTKRAGCGSTRCLTEGESHELRSG